MEKKEVNMYAHTHTLGRAREEEIASMAYDIVSESEPFGYATILLFLALLLPLFDFL